jgi:hypothetical protein
MHVASPPMSGKPSPTSSGKMAKKPPRFSLVPSHEKSKHSLSIFFFFLFL